MVVDGESGDLLDQLEEIDCRVEQRGLELLLEVDFRALHGISALDVLRHIDKSGDMDSELAEDRANNVEVEDIMLRTLFRQSFDGLKVKLVSGGSSKQSREHTLAREMDRKQTLIIIPEIVT